MEEKWEGTGLEGWGEDNDDGEDERLVRGEERCFECRVL